MPADISKDITGDTWFCKSALLIDIKVILSRQLVHTSLVLDTGCTNDFNNKVSVNCINTAYVDINEVCNSTEEHSMA